jgi:hypothetical protein
MPKLKNWKKKNKRRRKEKVAVEEEEMPNVLKELKKRCELKELKKRGLKEKVEVKEEAYEVKEYGSPAWMYDYLWEKYNRDPKSYGSNSKNPMEVIEEALADGTLVIDDKMNVDLLPIYDAVVKNKKKKKKLVNTKLCRTCKKEASTGKNMCSRCKPGERARYCGILCQKADWKVHKKNCAYCLIYVEPSFDLSAPSFHPAVDMPLEVADLWQPSFDLSAPSYDPAVQWKASDLKGRITEYMVVD